LKKILVSQRLDEVAGRGEYRDSTDTRLGQFLWSAGYVPIPLYSSIDELEVYISEQNADGIVLSGGNDIGQAPNRDRLETFLLKHSISKQIPLIGICRGMQMINHVCNGSLISVSGHVREYHTLEGVPPFKGRTVNSYHGYGIVESSLGNNLKPSGFSCDKVIEAFHHTTNPWLGIMWHPERENQFSQEDIHLFQAFFQ
jgi:gamma-glutamyl-gamma-aminobutyrate hydrolase PuuD